MIENYKEAYRMKYGSLPMFFNLETEDYIWMIEQIKLAVDGKRGEITEEEMGEKFGFTDDEDVIYSAIKLQGVG